MPTETILGDFENKKDKIIMYEKLFQKMQDAKRCFNVSIQICFNYDGKSGYIIESEMNTTNEFSSLQQAEQILNDMFSM